MSLTDASFRDFQSRLGRIRTIHASGRRFEAPGTLGAPPRAGRGRRRLALVVPLLMAAAALTGVKAVVHAHVGAAGYEARLADLQAGDGLSRAGAVLMQPDPATLALSAAVRGIVAGLPR
ncbi:MAG: hypothetical protein KJZ85_12635 [Rhodobacteraceae bacterium]|jgi:hypothetical protein|nr:hypothetical protein [Paracoccaceae bacterium]